MTELDDELMSHLSKTTSCKTIQPLQHPYSTEIFVYKPWKPKGSFSIWNHKKILSYSEADMFIFQGNCAFAQS